MLRHCGAYFSVKTGTVMRKSHLSLRKWRVRDLFPSLEPASRACRASKASPGYRRASKDRMVHATAHPQGLGERRYFPLHRPSRSRRNLHESARSVISTKVRSSRLRRGTVGKTAVVGAQRSQDEQGHRPWSSRTLTPRPYRSKSSPIPPPTAQRSTLTTQRPTRAFPSTTRACVNSVGPVC